MGLFDRLENHLRRSVRDQEWMALAVSAGFFFCLLAAYYTIRPVREQFSAAVGSIGLPTFYLATFIVTLLLTPVFGVLVARYRRRHFVPAVYAFFVLCLIAFIPLFQLEAQIGTKLLGAVFFVWVSVFNLVVVALFWSLMADIFAPEQARRLFPLVAIGGAAGAIGGPALTKALVFLVGVPGLMVASALLLCLCIAAIYWLLGWSRANPVAGEPDRDQRVIGGSVLAGMMATLRTPFLRNVALLMLLGDCVGTVVYAFLADYNGATFKSAAERINFSSSLDLAINLLQILFQLFLTRQLMMRLGPISAIVLDGVIKAVMLLGMVVIGGWWIIVVAVVTRASAYGIFKPAADSLYTEVDAETRYKGKNFIDTTVWRFGDVVVSNGLNLLRAAGVGVPGLALLTATAGLASAWVGRRIGRRMKPAQDTPAAD